MIEKEHNAELNKQLQVQMEQLLDQNEKFMDSEAELNEMKLKLLIKFDQIKLLEDYYNQQMEAAGQPDRRIFLDVELDDSQLRYIVERLYKQNEATQSHRQRQ